MKKPSPNPPDAEITSPQKPLTLKASIPPHTPSHLFVVAPNINTETLLVHATESLASASVMASDLAGFLEGPHRNTLLGIQQVIMLGELAVNRALDNVDPQD
ncbi:hypothetical protein PMA3_24700 [Pseudomonas silesiensis]|uniref:DUF3077 domain-containing protein n=1 Tax=Pseudomonas silesiensis TaxID=1853130 RepID=A0A191YZK5_9PSED|nr:DUF6124 family protein [Pseudomonas silesiensis]ANJ58193.1 hypothetical protein PMA3_24700 [Pseudomonas silesiensis]